MESRILGGEAEEEEATGGGETDERGDFSFPSSSYKRYFSKGRSSSSTSFSVTTKFCHNGISLLLPTLKSEKDMKIESDDVATAASTPMAIIIPDH